MAPTLNEINEKALQPYMKNQITQQAALDRGIQPIRNFMFKQTHENELGLFLRLAKLEKPKNKNDVTIEIKTAKSEIAIYNLKLPRKNPNVK